MTTLYQNWPPGYRTRTVNITQGEFEVSSQKDVVISTVLGSCISVCLFDDVKGVGGMNHYLLVDGAGGNKSDLKYGAHSIELLINRILRKGADRSDIKAKVFGGSTMSNSFAQIGPRNAQFAMDYLRDEGFPVIAKDVGGSVARRLNFHAVTGQARVGHTAIDQAPAPKRIEPVKRQPAKNSITLF